MYPRTLQTARLLLRRPEAGDAYALAQAANDLRIARAAAGIPHPFKLSDAEGFLAGIRPGDPIWLIERDGALLGMIGLPGELGYWLVVAAWGQGYAQEAAQAVLALQFSDPAADAITAGHYSDNARSARLLERLGFQETGFVQRYSSARGQDLTERRMRLTREAWAVLNPPCIETARLQITPLEPADGAPLQALVTRPEVGRMLFRFPPNWSLQDAGALIAQNRWLGRHPLRLAIRRQGRFIGSIGLGAGSVPEIFYFLDPAEAGQGLMREALAAFLLWSADFWRLEGFQAGVFADNPASIHLLESQGFLHAGPQSFTSLAREGPQPGWLYRRPTRR